MNNNLSPEGTAHSDSNEPSCCELSAEGTYQLSPMALALGYYDRLCYKYDPSRCELSAEGTYQLSPMALALGYLSKIE